LAVLTLNVKYQIFYFWTTDRQFRLGFRVWIWVWCLVFWVFGFGFGSGFESIPKDPKKNKPQTQIQTQKPKETKFQTQTQKTLNPKIKKYLGFKKNLKKYIHQNIFIEIKYF